jgi:drug/metabolite transporter (DMT)-like permease
LGEFFALITALIWAGAVIFFRMAGRTVSPFTLNFFRVTVTSCLFILTMVVLRQPIFGQAPIQDYLILAFSGIVAIAVSDTLFHKSLNITGAGINAIVDCLYSPFVILFAFVLIDERLGALQYSGMVLVVAGVVVAAGHRSTGTVTGRKLVIGILWGAAAMATLTFGIVIAKPVLNHSPVLWATTIRQLASLLAMAPIALLTSKRKEVIKAFTPTRTWKYTIPGTILGSYLALLCWIAGMKYTQAGAAAILNQTSTIFILLFATMFLGEKFTPRKLVASILAVGGILMVTLGG